MIKNEKQLRVAKSKLAGLEAARSALDASDKMGWRAYADLIDEASARISDYEDIKAGVRDRFSVESLDDVGEAIIKARIARGWTHAHMAGVLGVSQQQIQKDEARDYENAGLARVAEILDEMGYELVGEVRPKDSSGRFQRESAASGSNRMPVMVPRRRGPSEGGETRQSITITLTEGSDDAAAFARLVRVLKESHRHAVVDYGDTNAG